MKDKIIEPTREIIILGQKLKQKNMPKLYLFAVANPGNVASTIKNICRIEHWEITPANIECCISKLESDLCG